MPTLDEHGVEDIAGRAEEASVGQGKRYNVLQLGLLIHKPFPPLTPSLFLRFLFPAAYLSTLNTIYTWASYELGRPRRKI